MDSAIQLRVLGQTAYPRTAASARVRVANYIPYLRDDGVELLFEPTLTSQQYQLLSSQASPARKAGALLASVGHAARGRAAHDVFLVHRLRLLSPVPGLDPPSHLDLYDLDDALFLGSPADVNRRFQWAKQEARRCIACMRRAQVVIAGNSFLAEHARRHAARVEVIPTCIEPDRQPIRIHEPAEIVTVGWVGSHTTSAYLKPILPVFESLNGAGIVVRLVVLGGDTGLREPWIEHRPWTLEGETAALASFDIGVMPLPDSDWARGKCGYKLLQYFSAGVPAVASPVGVNVDLIGTERGILASSMGEWRAALEQLIADPDRRREMGSAARAFVQREYSYRRWAPELAALMRSVVR